MSSNGLTTELINDYVRARIREAPLLLGLLR
jgi:hypothetical protein